MAETVAAVRTLTKASEARIKRFTDWFISSDYVQAWSEASIGEGAYSRYQDKRERYSRCWEAAENGCDGSTHREVIHDWRQAFAAWLGDKRGARWNECLRFSDAVTDYFDSVEAWHEANGSLDEEVG